MFGNEPLVNNPFERVLDIQVRKKEHQPAFVNQVQCDGGTVAAGSTRELRVVYREHDESVGVNRPFRFELAVAGRRILSEFRDLSRSRLLTITAASLKAALTRAN
jgi:hypothetical protein